MSGLPREANVPGELMRPPNPTRRELLKQGCAGIAGIAFGNPALLGQNDSRIPDLDQLRRQHQESGVVSPARTYRAMEWEFHTPAQQTFDINVEAAIGASRVAGAESLMFYAQDHWGYAFYPSESAVRHPNLKFDLFGSECTLARKAGLSVTCYYSLQFNNQCAIAHPDWAWTNEDGSEQRFSGRWHIICLDSPYRQYVLAMIDEIFSRYEVDELFLDIFGIQFVMYNHNGIQPFCFCRHTEDAWQKEFPDDPYREGFKTREGWTRRYEWHQRRSMADMLDEIIRIARKHRPNLLISLNGGPESFPDAIMQRVSFIYAEPLDCPTGIALGSILMRGWERPNYQAGVFTEYGYSDIYPAELARVQADALIVQNARTFFVGNAGVLSGIDGQGFSHRWFSVAREAWEDVRNVDCLLGPDLQPLLSTAVFYSNPTRKESEADKRPYDFRNSLLGALELMTHAGRPVESLIDTRLQPDVLNRFELLVLPEVLALSDEHAGVIRDWVGRGGTLISSYRSGLLDERHRPRGNFALADVIGADYLSTDTAYAYDATGKQREGNAITTYLEPHGHPLTQAMSIGTVGLPGPFIRMRETSAQEVMSYRLPLFAEDVSKNLWVGWGSPPPGPNTAGVAVAFNRYGKGQSLYLGVPIFWAMQWRAHWIEEWVPAMVRRLVPGPVAELRTQPQSEYVHGSFFHDRARQLILVQILDAIALVTKGERRPTPTVEITLDAARFKIRAAEIVWPKTKTVEALLQAGRQSIRLENPDRYTALCLRLAEHSS
jgi:Hypothetical glycosyl hydrolase 6/Beta-galactosidase trimerisation domain